MKNSEIHKEFQQSEIRNFLAISLAKCFDRLTEIGNGRTAITMPQLRDKNPFKWGVIQAKKEIETLHTI